MTRETIAKIVKASGVSAGELILIHFWSENADKTVADQFAAAVAALGASPVVLQQARSVNREIFAGAKESCFDDRYFGLFSKFDAVLDVFACQPIVLGYELEDAQMDLYRRYISQLFEKLVTCRRFAQICIPTEATWTAHMTSTMPLSVPPASMRLRSLPEPAGWRSGRTKAACCSWS